MTPADFVPCRPGVPPLYRAADAPSSIGTARAVTFCGDGDAVTRCVLKYRCALVRLGRAVALVLSPIAFLDTFVASEALVPR